jgi:pyruvate kinase
MTSTRAKIVCTMGPATRDIETIRELIKAGMNVARLNFSHGYHDEHREMMGNIRQAAQELGAIVGIMVDLQGPKIRVRRFVHGQITLTAGQRFTITTRNVMGDEQHVSTFYEQLPQDLKPGDRVLLDDGLIVLQVVETTPEDVVSEVVVGGVLKDNKGINVPHAALSAEAVTRKDRADLEFAMQEGADYVAMSFVRSPADVRQLRGLMHERSADIPIIAKIEKPQALEVIDEIIEEADGIMVARGDLGVEMAAELVPGIQKDIIGKCNRQGKPVITATQMLESMIQNPRPTRAEASDVANAILDGTDAVMLSGESAAGKYPVEAVNTMRRIIEAAERRVGGAIIGRSRRQEDEAVEINEGIAATACLLAEQVRAVAIASITLTGSMARKISKYRPRTLVFAVSQHAQSLRRLSVFWGIRGLLMADLDMSADEAMVVVRDMLIREMGFGPGERIVLTAGVPFSERKATNMVRVEITPPA